MEISKWYSQGDQATITVRPDTLRHEVSMCEMSMTHTKISQCCLTLASFHITTYVTIGSQP